MRRYDHIKIEKKWQKKWKEQGLYVADNKEAKKKNYYTLVEFPYPSGNLHIGHWYAFAVPDIFARYKRMQGFNVLFPIGFDSFGLPAENAAIKHKINPRTWTYDNIARMEQQIKSIGSMFDWNRKVITSDPEYYKWTQLLFLKFYEKGLAYRGKGIVNWDPADKTVLADEQVLPDGTAERSGAVVEKRELEQWFFKITDYADRLVDDLDPLGWPEEIKESQRNWIGRSAGVELDFPLKDSKETITVFTTRADTLFGATYMVLAPEHELVRRLQKQIENWEEVVRYIEQSGKKSEIERTAEGKDKTGVELKGVRAVNPANTEEIPVFIADYVLAHYGTGAIMAVPAHDQRDFVFAKKYQLPVVEVVTSKEKENKETPYTGDGVLKNSDAFDGLSGEEARGAITDHVGGRAKTTYKLRDWLLSRQRYWGCPIPIVYDSDGNPHPVPQEHLPWLLPDDVDFTPTGEPPLARSKEFKERTEKIFGKGWRPEYDTMDTFVDSSWYFLRYTDPNNKKMFAAKEALAAWMPVDRYSGGAEHTTMHVLYSRFFHKVLYDLGLVNEPEPYRMRMNRGIILGTDGRKMSKRWENVVDPDEQVERVGTDAVRTYLAFIGPYNIVGHYPWDLGGIAGMRRFLERVWLLGSYVDDGDTEDSLLHVTIAKVGKDIERFKFNTAVSALMILTNELEKENRVSRQVFEILLKLLAPFAPHLTEELWERLGHSTSIHEEEWPSYDEEKIKVRSVNLAVQINGKVRGLIELPAGASKGQAIEAGRGLPNIAKWLGKKEPKKVVFVPDRLVNFVV